MFQKSQPSISLQALGSWGACHRASRWGLISCPRNTADAQMSPPPPSQVPRTCEERWSYEQPPHGHTPQCSQQVCSRTGFPRGEGCFQTVSSAGSLGSPRKAPRLSGERHAVGQGAAPPCTWLHWTRTDGKKRAFISHLAKAFLLSPTPVAFSLFGLRLTTRNVFYALPNAHIPVCMWD